MKNIIICEGSTDYYLLQYYMREALGWKDNKQIQSNILRVPDQKSRNLIKNADILTIMSTGGCSRLTEGLKETLTRNYLTPPDLSEMYSKIVIVTDRDDHDTENDFIQSIQGILDNFNVSYPETFCNNKWLSCEMTSQLGIVEKIDILLLIIPFEQNGAMETFLLNAISNDNPYDKRIIQSCNSFVDNIDPENKYLTSRRYITKAKFDTYFSIRTPAEQYAERQQILKSVKWEQYTQIQTDFLKLSEI